MTYMCDHNMKTAMHGCKKGFWLFPLRAQSDGGIELTVRIPMKDRESTQHIDSSLLRAITKDREKGGRETVAGPLVTISSDAILLASASNNGEKDGENLRASQKPKVNNEGNVETKTITLSYLRVSKTNVGNKVNNKS